jgi:hypothetical protein
MRALSCIVVALVASAFGTRLGAEQVQDRFRSDNYTVTWGTVAAFDADAELEIGRGSGHGFTLGWLRFRPEKGRVDVLSIQLHENSHSYRSKWPPDRAPVVVKRAQMKSDTYVALLRDLAVVDSAKLRPVERNSITGSTNDFWVCARLVAGNKTLVDLDWAGYRSSRSEADFAKPQAAVALGHAAVKGLDFKEHALTDEERAWASAKFASDWKKIKNLEFHWWVRERYIIMIGVVGDTSALPALGDAMQGDPKDRCVYHAINAVTRLTKKDVRDKPVEEMDVEKTRRRVLNMLRDRK